MTMNNDDLRASLHLVFSAAVILLRKTYMNRGLIADTNIYHYKSISDIGANEYKAHKNLT